MSSPSPYLMPASKWSWKKGLVALGACLFFFTEFGLRVVNVPSIQQRLNPVEFEEGRSPLQAHPYTAYAGKPNFKSSPSDARQVSHNSLGFRGEETAWVKGENVIRVICLGGSSTYGEGVSSNERTWPARLEHLLLNATEPAKYEVINLGVPGYSSFESLTQFALIGLELKPDVVVVYHSLADTRSALSEMPAPDNTHYRTNWPTTHRSDLDQLFEVSRVYRLVRSFGEDPSLRNFGGHAIATMQSAGTFQGAAAESRGLLSFDRNLNSIVALAASIDARVVLATQAVDHRDLIGGQSYEQHALALQRTARMIERVATENENSVFVDAGSIIEEEANRQIEQRGSENLFGWEDRLHDAGAELLAMTIADAVLNGTAVD